MATHAGTQVFPTRQHYCQQTWPTLHRWLRHYNLFNITYDHWEQHILNQWPQHTAHSFNSISHRDIQYLKSVTRNLVVHCRDHAATAIFVFCPYLYWTVLHRTFGDTDVYTKLNVSPSQATQFLQQLANQPWLRKYNWGCSSTHQCPTAYILLKQKKQFLAARPIINYRRFIFEKLFRATAIILQRMLQTCMPHTFGLDSLPHIFHTLQQFFAQTPEDVTLTIHNQDLAGFFTSIPAPRILQSVQALLDMCQKQHPHVDAATVFSVDLSQTETTLRIFRGRPRKASKIQRQIRFGDIYRICALSLQASIFTHMQQTFQQVRGSAIGNQISPTLANITVSHVEHQWISQPHTQSLLQRHSDGIYIIRYVDNRLVIVDYQQQHHAAMQQFLTDTFYQSPVLLEPEPDNTFLGCDINPDQQTISYIQPANTWQFQLYTSAASKQHKLSAAYSRICLAARHSYPHHQAKRDIESLIQTYISIGYPEQPLRTMASRMLRRAARVGT